jgi:hypothetical protein
MSKTLTKEEILLKYDELNYEWNCLISELRRVKIECESQIEFYKKNGLTINQAQTEYCYLFVCDLMNNHGIAHEEKD